MQQSCAILANNTAVDLSTNLHPARTTGLAPTRNSGKDSRRLARSRSTSASDPRRLPKIHGSPRKTAARRSCSRQPRFSSDRTGGPGHGGGQRRQGLARAAVSPAPNPASCALRVLTLRAERRPRASGLSRSNVARVLRARRLRVQDRDRGYLLRGQREGARGQDLLLTLLAPAARDLVHASGGARRDENCARPSPR